MIFAILYNMEKMRADCGVQDMKCSYLFNLRRKNNSTIKAFCVYEDKEYYYGYVLQQKASKRSVSIRIDGKKKPTSFINCDAIYQIEKTAVISMVVSNYDYQEIRSLIDKIVINDSPFVLSAENKRLPYGKINPTPEIVQNRRNSKIQQLFHETKRKLEQAKINSAQKEIKALEAKLDEIRRLLGYELPLSSREKKERAAEYKVTNRTPLSGGAFSPK